MDRNITKILLIELRQFYLIPNVEHHIIATKIGTVKSILRFPKQSNVHKPSSRRHVSFISSGEAKNTVHVFSPRVYVRFLEVNYGYVVYIGKCINKLSDRVVSSTDTM